MSSRALAHGSDAVGFRMSSQPNPDSIEVPPVSPDERAEWEAMKARMADGDESGLLPWDDLATELGL
jgi:hypothetical protein